ncbi:MAG: ACP phosphodiesterase [Synechococcales bacterium]|nr:ACP phosphodiesterase [Synechococcales bacterium]
MNYLAHLFLGDRSPEGFIGSLLGDFRKDLCWDCYSPTVLHGIDLHQKIDIFTDRHPIFRTSKRLIDPSRRRVAGIILDVFYDHCLAQHWSDYSSMPLDRFTNLVYQALQTHQEILPTRLQAALPFMIRQDWLGSYRSLSGVALTLQRIARRLRRETAIDRSLEDLQLHYEALDQSFQSFFPDLQTYVQQVMVGATEG